MLLSADPFFCSTAPQAFFRPDRKLARPSRAAAVKDGRSCGHPKGLSLTAASTMAALADRGVGQPASVILGRCAQDEFLCHLSSPYFESTLQRAKLAIGI